VISNVGGFQFLFRVLGDGPFCQRVVSLLSDSTQLPVRVFRFDARIHDERELIARMSVVADGDQLVIHPIERLPQPSRDQLAKALKESLVDIVLGSCPTAQVITVELPRFSLIGVSEQPGLMSTELRGMFGYWLIQDA
jgi:Holliday junction resolvasome RuvABC ATP-dependent DNA helicase subunit